MQIITKAVGSTKMKSRKLSFSKIFWKQRYMQLFVFLGIAFIMVFSYAPMVGLLMAFKNYKIQMGYSGIFTADWVGLKWFKEFFTDYKFPQLLKNTLGISVLKLVFTFPVPIIFAVMLN